jgi:DNA-3-methyladenine glycosylase I
MPKRCEWVGDWKDVDEIMVRYHDEEWGTPKHDDRRLFEDLVLDGAQAGLSWRTILNKREGYREAFDNFDPAKVAQYDDAKIEELLQNPGIIRNRQKVNSAVKNARAFLKVQEEFGSFDAYIWGFVEGVPIQNNWQTLSQLPAKTELSETISKDLKKRGFSFVGPTIVYAFMQAVGMVNDHTVDCFRYHEIAAMD